MTAKLSGASKIQDASRMYRTVPAFGGAPFNLPVQVVFAPDEPGRAFVAERNGRILVVREGAKSQREVFLDLTSRLKPRENDGLLSFVFHPRFTENGFLYVWYSIHVRGTRADRLSRFKVLPGSSVADPNSELPLLTQPTGPSGHDGGMLLFGPDGYLYLSIGDGDEHLNEPAISHQRIDRSFFGVVLRLDVDRKPGSLPPNAHPAVHPGTYTIPADNPFVGVTSYQGQAVVPARVRTEFWAVGLRNPWRLDFDSLTGLLWCGDVGLHEHEEINLIVRGGNYGWDYREGIGSGVRKGPPAAAQFVNPIWDYDHTVGLSITGGFVYHGQTFPRLEGNYLCGDYVLGKIWAISPDGQKPVGNDRVVQIAKVPGAVSFTRDPSNGDPLITSYSDGMVYRLVPGQSP
ncbi:MAG: PQQ-dependent sugar dehydrogenase [Opitutaceae bacterium]